MADDATVIRQRPPLSLVSGPWNEADPAGPLVGMQLAHFELREFVGGGGMGAVYRALDTLLNREVAVKVLSPDLARDPEVVRRFKNEAQSAARLDHEHITRVYFVGEDQGWHYIVFEFIEGVNVRDFVARGGPLPLADALLYTVQIARAIEHASGRDVVHRDIKPSNVLIAGPGRVKVVDMGLARVLLVDQSSADLTASGVTLGTFDYISPEQARDPRAADVRSDLYSLGCTLYFMLTGRPPFPQGTVLQKLLQHQGDEPPDPREVRPDLPVELTQILRRMMAKSPAQRYQSPRALIADLSSLAARLNLPLAPLDRGWMTAPATSFDWARQLNWALPVAALLVIVLVLDALWRPANDPPARPQAPEAARSLAQDPLNGTGTEKQSPGTKAKTNVVADAAAPQPSPPAAQRSGEGTSARSTRSSNGGFATLLRSAGGIFKKTAEAWLESPAPRANSAAAAPSLAPTTPRVAQPNAAPAAAPTAAPAPPAAVSDGLLVVTDEPLAPREYRSLRTACSVAKDGEIIELRFDGRREAEPVTVGMRRVTIRPGKGYRPVIVFRPNQTDPIRYPRSMISVAGGRLTLLNLQVELEVPPLEAIPAASWSLIASQRAELIRLEGCNLSIRNLGVGRAALHPDVAFFDFKPPPGSDSMMMGSLAPRDLAEGRIDLEDCVLRGEANWLRVADAQPLHVTWNNGLLAISERAVNLAPRTMSDRPPGALRLDLRHLTAAVAGGLVRLPSPQDFPLYRALEVDCADSIWLGHNEPFVTQLGAVGSGDLRGSLAWKGGRNFFLGFPVMYGRAGDRSASSLSSLSFAQWQGQWGAPQEKQLTRADFVELPELARPFHGHLAEDYALDDQAWDNPALGGASDSQDAGVLAAGLTSGGTAPARLAPETRAALDAIP